MTGKIVLFLTFLTAAFNLSAQTAETTKKATRPDIPGTFVVELGLNRALQAPQAWSMGFWGSRTVNVYYQYDIRILKSRFSFVPGVGVSLERFKLKNLRVLGYNDGDSVELLNPVMIGFPGIRKSQFINNYVEIPLEFKYSSKPEDPARSFKLSAGARVGYMFDSFSKIKYKEDGEMKKLKDKQDFNFNKFRYGVFGKIGIGNFGLVGYYNLTNLFDDGKGLSEDGVAKDFSTYTVGISLSSF